MNPTGFLKSYLTENELREFVISNKYLDNHTEIIQILSLETHYFTILKRLFPYMPIKKKNIEVSLYLNLKFHHLIY